MITRSLFHSLGRSPAARMWAIFILALGSLVLAKIGTEAAALRQARELSEYEQRKRTLSYQVSTYFHHDVADLQKRVTPRLPLKPQRIGPDKNVVIIPGTIFDEGAAGWRVEVRFVEGRMTRAVVMPPDGGPPTSETSESWMLAERARRATLALAAITYGSAALLLLFAWPWRRQIGQVCLAAAMAGIAAWMLAPHFKLTRSITTDMVVLLGATSVLLVATFLILIPRRSRIISPLCPACGYNLTANESGTCPECGTRTPAATRWERLAQFDNAAQALRQAAES
ncbi:MAG: hypothetical protein JWM97_3139 [Phycisphaerales bacterium]|nr:hypothetical protein [Phycisphaerales bacterium]